MRFTQNEAVIYMQERGVRITSTELSILGKFHAGPPFEKYGPTKIFLQPVLDAFIEHLQTIAIEDDRAIMSGDL